MTRIEYNGGPDVFVGSTEEPKPTIAKDGITEGASIIYWNDPKVDVFNGDETSENNGWKTVITLG